MAFKHIKCLQPAVAGNGSVTADIQLVNVNLM